MITPANFVALPMRSLPLYEVGGASVSSSGVPYLSDTEHGTALLLSAGMNVRVAMPAAVTDRLTACMWLRTDSYAAPLDADGIPQEVQIPLISACTQDAASGIPTSGWSFSRLQRMDGVSDLVFSVYDGGSSQHYRFVGNNSHVWQFVVLQMVGTAKDSVFSVTVDGQPLGLDPDTPGSPGALDGLSTDRLLCVNCPIPAYADGVVAITSAGDFIHDIFVTTDDIGDASFVYEDISSLGVEGALVSGQRLIASVPLLASVQSGMVGVVETASGKFAVDTDGSYYSLQDSRFDVSRNLKLETFPDDMVPYKTTSGSQFSISPESGIVLVGSGLKLL